MMKKIHEKDLTEEQKRDLELQGFWTSTKPHPSGVGIITEFIMVDMIYGDKKDEEK